MFFFGTHMTRTPLYPLNLGVTSGPFDFDRADHVERYPFV
jgi:hypothetical protein